MSDEAPLYFGVRLGGLFPASAKSEEAMREIKGRVSVKITGGKANQRRRSLYWSVAALVVPLLNEAHGLTIDEDDLHDITRDKLKLYDEIRLPSGEVYRKRKSTSNRAMNEADRSAYTTRALELWSTWTGVDVTTLRDEAERDAA
jgi:hypothetical protein